MGKPKCNEQKKLNATNDKNRINSINSQRSRNSINTVPPKKFTSLQKSSLVFEADKSVNYDDVET